MLFKDHYGSALTLHSVLSIVTITMLFVSLIPPFIPHLAVYVLIFWTGAGLIFYVGTSEHLPAMLIPIREDIIYIYLLFFG